jgi:hypothetical protein
MENNGTQLMVGKHAKALAECSSDRKHLFVLY